jgi:hypothetical protein
MSAGIGSGVKGRKDIFTLAFEGAFQDAGGAAFCKFVNWFTGFGKTHSAAAFALDLFTRHGVYPIFLAPLQSLVSGFEDTLKKNIAGASAMVDIEATLLRQRADVPVYRFYSNDYHINDKHFFVQAQSLFDWLTSHKDVFGQLEKDHDRKSRPKIKSFRSALADARIKANQCADSNFLLLPRYDDDYEDQKKIYVERARAVLGMAQRIVKKAIRMTIESRHRPGSHPLPYLNPAGRRGGSANVVHDMMGKLFPIQAFLEKPGIIISTASKFAMEQQFIYWDNENEVCCERKYDDVFQFIYELNQPGNFIAGIVHPGAEALRAVTFIDEEEDSYWYLFDQHKSKINGEGKNDLNWVVNEWLRYFDISWPRQFEKGNDRTLATKLYLNLSVFTRVAPKLWDKLVEERAATDCTFIPEKRQIALFREALDQVDAMVSALFSDRDLRELMHELIDPHNSKGGYARFREKARVLAAFREAINASGIRGDDESEYAAYRRVYTLLKDKKYFEMSRVSFGEWREQPGHTFFDGAAYVMDTELFQRTQLSSNTGNQTIKLKLHETGRMPKRAFTLDHYLKVIILIAKIMRQPSMSMSQEDQTTYYTHLAKFRTEIRKLFKSRNMAPTSAEPDPDELDEAWPAEAEDMSLPVTDEFIYASLKSIVGLEESRHQADEYNKEKNVSLTVTISNLRDTPEEDLRLLISRNNGVYLLSATGGLQSAASGAFNIFWIQKCLDDVGGYLYPMSQDELRAVQKHVREWIAKRERRVTIFNQQLPRRRIPTSPGFPGLEHRFLSTLSGKMRPGKRYNAHKQDEISGLVCALDRMLSTPIRSGMSLCINVQWMRHCLMALCETRTFIRQLDHSGNIFAIDPARLPAYASMEQHDEIHIVVYEAERFRRLNPSQTGIAPQSDDPGEFSMDLYEALDITSHRLLLWSAYGSASRGVNFITTSQGKKKDFELIMLVNAPYFTRHTRPSPQGMVIEAFQSMVQRMRHDRGGPLVENRTDLLRAYACDRDKLLAEEHIIEVTRTLFQALGRVEREPEALMPLQEIYIHTGVAKYIYLAMKYAPELAARASPSQSTVLTAIDIDNIQSALFSTDEQRLENERKSLAMACSFSSWTAALPRKFRSSAVARRTWEGIFDRKMFTDPHAYLRKLRRLKVPDEIISSLYLRVPINALLYTKQAAKAGEKHSIITDFKNGTDLYDWTSLLGPASLLRSLPATKTIMKHAAGFPDSDPAWVDVPQPWFARDIMRGFIAECVFADFTREHLGITTVPGANGVATFLQVLGHPKESDLYQLYDFYLEPESTTLVGIDIKNWSRHADQALTPQLQQTALDKHAQLRALCRGKRIHAIYINLCGAYKYLVDDPPGGVVKYMSLYVPDGEGAAHGWIANTNLIDALLGK